MKLFSIVFIFFLWGWSAPFAGAQEQDPAAQFERADRYYRAGDYKEAFKGFKALYVDTGEPALLYNIGQCHRLLKEYAEAIIAYKNYLREVPDSTIKEQVNALIAECEKAQQEAKTQPLNNDNKPPEVVEEPEPPKPSKLHLILYGAAGASALVSIGTGRTALINAEEAESLSEVEVGELAPDPQAVADASSKARRAATLSTITTVVAIAAAGGGFLVYKKNQKTSVAFTGSGASLQVQF
jgi:tetratricopeptide (TPR) repeat protein